MKVFVNVLQPACVENNFSQSLVCQTVCLDPFLVSAVLQRAMVTGVQGPLMLSGDMVQQSRPHVLKTSSKELYSQIRSLSARKKVPMLLDK